MAASVRSATQAFSASSRPTKNGKYTKKLLPPTSNVKLRKSERERERERENPTALVLSTHIRLSQRRCAIKPHQPFPTLRHSWKGSCRCGPSSRFPLWLWWRRRRKDASALTAFLLLSPH